MPDSLSPNDLLAALRARLEMDAGLGVEYAAAAPADVDAALSSPGNARASDNISGAAGSGAARTERPAPPASPAIRKPNLEPKPERARSDTVASLVAAGTAGFATLVPPTEAPPSPEKEAELAPLREASATCGKCELCERRLSVVWGEGSLDADFMFIGEGPGRDEDEQGRPFVGRSGRLLTDIIEKGMKMPRSHVYITNVVKCRPPGNRDPRPAEVAACGEYLQKQIDVVKPKVIVAVGGVAGCALLGLPPRTSGLRGKWHEYGGIPLRVIYHPSYLLRQRNSATDRTRADKDTWQDILDVMEKGATKK